jgi:hypothetical protein
MWLHYYLFRAKKLGTIFFYLEWDDSASNSTRRMLWQKVSATLATKHPSKPKNVNSDQKISQYIRLACISRQQFKVTPKAMCVFHFLLARIETWFACLKTSQVQFSQVKGEHLFTHGQTLSFPGTTPSISIRIYIALKNRPSGEPPRSHFTASRLGEENRSPKVIFSDLVLPAKR